jgi:protease I
MNKLFWKINMLEKIVLLIVAYQGYQPIEYGYTRQELEKAGIKVIISSTIAGNASAQPSEAHAKQCNDSVCGKAVKEYPEYATASIDLVLKNVNPARYDGIFIIGGPGALEFLDNQATYTLMQEFAKKDKPFGAICISPRILAKAGLLSGKKATGWNGDHKLEDIFKEHHVQYIKQPVIVDGNLITADGPSSAHEFGRAIVARLQK